MKRLFTAGDPVICINDNFSWANKHYCGGLSWPRFGDRYIVRAYVCDGRYPAIVLCELHNPEVVYMNGAKREAGFWDGRFVKAAPPIEIKVTTKREKETV